MAISAFKDSLEKDANNPLYHYHIGMAYLKNGEKDKAKSMLTKAIALNAGFNGVDEARRALSELN